MAIRITADLMKQLGWWDELTEAEKKEAGQELEDRPFWRYPAGRHQARLRALWQCQGALRGVDLPGSGAQAPRAALHPAPGSAGRLRHLAGRQSLWRLPTQYASVQEKDVSKGSPSSSPPAVWSNTRGGDETRSNPWLAELQQEMFVEMNPADANDVGVRDGQDVGGGAGRGRVKVKALVTPRVKPGLAFMPFHFGGHFEGQDLRAKYPEGSDPYVLGSRST